MRPHPPPTPEVDPADLDHAVTAMNLSGLPRRLIPLFNVEAVAAAVFEPEGAPIVASAAFQAMKVAQYVDADLLARAHQARAAVTQAVETDGGDGVSNMAMLACAPAPSTSEWRLPPDIRAAAETRPDGFVVLTSQAPQRSRPLEDACRAYGLSAGQTRIVVELVRLGSVRLAAKALGISYETAREAVAEAMARMKVSRLPALVTRATSLAFGILPEENAEAVLQDLWGLTARQAAMAVLVAEGHTRAAAAEALGVSAAVARKEMEVVHLMLGVSTGSELARRVVEAQALRWLTEATGGEVGFAEAGEEPLRFAYRPDGRRIAFSDYGPRSGRPLLVVHSSATTRIVGRGLLKTLQDAGYRPISIDRPAFGLTDSLLGARPGAHDPFAGAVPDALRVLDLLKIKRVDIVARGGAQFVLALAQARPERVGRVVLVNPDPQVADAGAGNSSVQAAKAAMMRSPAVITYVAPLLSRLTTLAGTIERMRRDTRDAPADIAAIETPGVIRDYFRAQRPFATGRHMGWVNEQMQFFHGPGLAPLLGTHDWRVLVGAQDYLHDPLQVMAYWQQVLPDAKLELVADAGRYLALGQPQYVLAALTGP